jgi:uncharacterized RDD family membrane protein YckC
MSKPSPSIPQASSTPAVNPYAPPQSSPPSSEESSEPLVDASQGQRFVNMLIDGIARFVLAASLGFLLGLAGVGVDTGGVALPFFGFSFCLYYVFSEGMFGVTLGKLVTGTRVVGLDGSSPRLGAIVVRTLSRLVPFDALTFLSGSPG